MIQKLDIALVICGIIIGVCLSILYVISFHPINTFVINNETFEGVNGIHVDSGFYCVVTKGKTESQINTIKEHEICHDLVSKNYNHFCTDEEILGEI